MKGWERVSRWISGVISNMGFPKIGSRSRTALLASASFLQLIGFSIVISTPATSNLSSTLERPFPARCHAGSMSQSQFSIKRFKTQTVSWKCLKHTDCLYITFSKPAKINMCNMWDLKYLFGRLTKCKNKNKQKSFVYMNSLLLCNKSKVLWCNRNPPGGRRQVSIAMLLPQSDAIEAVSIKKDTHSAN